MLAAAKNVGKGTKVLIFAYKGAKEKRAALGGKEMKGI